MKPLILSDEQYETLRSELSSLYSYHWNDRTIHARDCGSKTLEAIDGSKIAEVEISDESLNKILPLIRKD